MESWNQAVRSGLPAPKMAMEGSSDDGPLPRRLLPLGDGAEADPAPISHLAHPHEPLGAADLLGGNIEQGGDSAPLPGTPERSKVDEQLLPPPQRVHVHAVKGENADS